MPDLMINRGANSTTGSVTQGRWLDQQQYLIETYRQIRDNLGQMEAEIEAARLRVTDWSRHRREPSRSRSLSYASISTNTSSIWSCSTCTDACCLHVHTDSAMTGSSCPSSSSCSSTCGITLPAAVAASLNAATLISAFLSVSAGANGPNATNPNCMNANQTTEETLQSETGTSSKCDSSPTPIKSRVNRTRSRTNRSSSPHLQ